MSMDLGIESIELVTELQAKCKANQPKLSDAFLHMQKVVQAYAEESGSPQWEALAGNAEKLRQTLVVPTVDGLGEVVKSLQAVIDVYEQDKADAARIAE